MSAGCMALCAGSMAQNEITVPMFDGPASTAIPFIAPAAMSQTYAPPNPPPIR
jgi:hypothetical protein